MAKIQIDKSKCIGCLECKRVCYEVFDVGIDGKAELRPYITEGDVEDAKTAEICCPMGAIKIIEDSWFKSDDDNDSKGGGILGFLDHLKDI